MLLAIITSLLVKRFSPKEGKKLNQLIKKQFKVKGSKAYKKYFNLLCDCVKWNGFVISTIVDSLKASIVKILDFIKEILREGILACLANIGN